MGCLNTSLCYIEQGGRYLMLHRTKKKQDPNAGKWIGVGGKFEDGESPEECARREVEEETGLSLSSLSLRGIVTFVSDVCQTEYMFLFTADQFTGELRTCDEGELAWIEKEKVLSLPLWEGDRVFLRLICEESPFFSLKLSYHGDELISAVLDGKRIAI